MQRRLRDLVRRLTRRDPGDVVALVAAGLLRYKLRTLLSVLGIVLGIAAVIAMLSVVEGARRETLRQVEALGLNNIVVRYRALAGVSRSPGLSAGDATRLRRLVPATRAVSPLVQYGMQVSGPARSRNATVLGVTEDYGEIMQLHAGAGRWLAPIDDGAGGCVAVIGAQLARSLFGFDDPIRQVIGVDRRSCRVVGVLAAQPADTRAVGSLPVRDLNQAVLLPLAAITGHPLQFDPASRVDEIWLQTEAGRRVVDVGKVVEHTLSRAHLGVDDFEVVIPREILASSMRVQRTFAVVVGSVAVIALLVGGIGIMNIMLASVLERTAEIGLRRTVGASRHDVVVQFLAESLALTCAGGVVGLGGGVVVSWLIAAYAGWATHVSVWAIGVAVVISGSVGLLFGSYPAARAAALQPIDAIRYE